MKQQLEYEQAMNLIARAIEVPVKELIYHKATISNYVPALEKALVKALTQKTEMRRELRRLNESVRHINALEDALKSARENVEVLEELLDREEHERADTDPTELQACCPHDLNIVKVEDNFPVNNVPSPTMEQAYHEWDLRTRFGVTPRSA